MKKLITILVMAFAVAMVSCSDPEKGATGPTGPKGPGGGIGADGKTIVTGLQITAYLAVATVVPSGGDVTKVKITYSAAGAATTDPADKVAADVFVTAATVLDYKKAFVAAFNALKSVKDGFVGTITVTDVVSSGTLTDSEKDDTVLTTLVKDNTLILTLKPKVGTKTTLSGEVAADKEYTYTQYGT